jgi:uncharacterized phosphosugar-binding protein
MAARATFVYLSGRKSLRRLPSFSSHPKKAATMSSLLADRYLADLSARVLALREALAEIGRAAAAVADAVAADRLIYVFGTGHSHMMAEEAHYRAGGLAAMVPILSPQFMLHTGAVESTRAERRPGVAQALLSSYPIGPGDVVFVVSNSGVNIAPVEAAEHVLRKGATLVAITSDAYSRQAAKGRTRLADLASIVLDNGGPPGDAVLALSVEGPSIGPVSTVIGAALINAVTVEAIALLQTRGIEPPVFLSANMPGSEAVNAALIARYQPRNPHL